MSGGEHKSAPAASTQTADRHRRVLHAFAPCRANGRGETPETLARVHATACMTGTAKQKRPCLCGVVLEAATRRPAAGRPRSLTEVASGRRAQSLSTTRGCGSVD